MRGLIGDRFLKWFFGSRSRQYKVNPASEGEAVLKNEGEMPDEQGCLPRVDSQEKEVPQEIEETGERNKFSDPVDVSDR